jgi:hypothetical protein
LESKQRLNLGNSEVNGKPRTYEALSGALSSFRSRQKHLMFLRLFPPNGEYRSGSDVPRGTRVGTLNENRDFKVVDPLRVLNGIRTFGHGKMARLGGVMKKMFFEKASSTFAVI